MIAFQVAVGAGVSPLWQQLFCIPAFLSIPADQLLQLVGSLLPHVGVGVTIHVQSERDGRVSQRFRECLGIDMALQRQRSIGVAHIMEAHFRPAQFLHNILEMDIQRLEPDEMTVCSGKDHIVLVMPAASSA